MKNEFEITLLDVKDINNLSGTTLNVEPTEFASLLTNCTRVFWCKDNIFDDQVSCTETNGNIYKYDIDYSPICVRPVIKYSQISKYANTFIEVDDLATSVTYFGKYPQKLVNLEENAILENLYQNDKLKKTGDFYTTDTPSIDKKEHVFKPYQHIEYEYNCRRFIRVADMFDGAISTAFVAPLIRELELYNGIYWIEVQQIKWIVDRKLDIAITKQALLSGLSYHYTPNYVYKMPFEETDMFTFLNTYFKEELIPHYMNKEINYSSDMYNDMVSKKFK